MNILITGLDAGCCGKLLSASSELNGVQQVVMAETVEDALERSYGSRFDILLVEVPLHQGDHDLLTDDLTRVPAPPRLVAISKDNEIEDLVQAISVGASAIVRYDTQPEFVVSTLRRIWLGEQPIEHTLVANLDLARRVLSLVRQQGRSTQLKNVLCPLSTRELELLSAVARGSSNKEIAGQLGVREQTIKKSVSGILRKVKANHRLHAVTIAVQNRWLTLD